SFSGSMALPGGHGFATSVDFNSTATVSVQGAIAKNSAGRDSNKVSKHKYTASNSTIGTPSETSSSHSVSKAQSKHTYQSDAMVKIKNATKAQEKSIRNMLHRIEDTPRGGTIIQIGINSGITVVIKVNDNKMEYETF